MACSRLMTSVQRIGGMSGLLAFVSFNAGWALGDAVQREAFSPRRDDISYLGALPLLSAVKPAVGLTAGLISFSARLPGPDVH